MLKYILLIPILCVASVNIGTHKNKEILEESNYQEKIIFENCQNLYQEQNSIQNINDEDEDYTLTIKLDYPLTNQASYENDEEKAKEYQRLKEYYTSNNDKIVQNLNLNDFEHVYVSKYSPFISIDTTYKELKANNLIGLTNISKNKNVECIYVNKNENAIEPSLYNAYDVMGTFDYVVRNKTYTGNNVTIGLLETGIPNKNHENFVGKDLEVRDVWYLIETVKDHANMMASVLIGPEGIVPESSIKAAQLYGDPIDEIDWFLDKGVDIINCSYTDATPNGVYQSDSAYMDYISYNYNIIFVAGSGNTGNEDGYIGNPGLALNAITVGAMNPYTFKMCDFSSYKVIDKNSKPELVAPGYSVNIRPIANVDGTSVSCALTTGIIALLMDYNPVYKTYPLMLKSALLVGCINSYVRGPGGGFDDKAGAGLVHFDNIKQNVKLASCKDVSKKLDPYGFTFTCEENDVIRFCLVWNAYATGKVGETTFPNYHLFVTNKKTGESLLQNTLYVTNKRLIECSISEPGEYFCQVVYDGTDIPKNSFCGYAGYVLKAN